MLAKKIVRTFVVIFDIEEEEVETSYGRTEIYYNLLRTDTYNRINSQNIGTFRTLENAQSRMLDHMEWESK